MKKRTGRLSCRLLIVNPGYVREYAGLSVLNALTPSLASQLPQ
jgi:hypothetical protein